MAKKPTTVAELARAGGRARAKKYNKQQIQAWGKLGGRPRKFRAEALARLDKLLSRNKSQAECARILGVSVRTIGRAVARLQPWKSKGQATVRKPWTKAEIRKILREAEKAEMEFPPLAGPPGLRQKWEKIRLKNPARQHPEE